jgi:drug/metabolite transporter (DMT)-like permease
MTHARPAHYLALAGGALLLGWAAIFVRWSDAGPVATAFWRFLLALPPLWGLVLVSRGWERRQGKTPGPVFAGGLSSGGWVRPAIFAGVMIGLDFTFWHYAIKFTTVANATLLATMATVFVALFGWLLFGQRLRGDFLVGLALAVAGAAGLALLRASGGTAPLNQPLGDLLGLGAALTYAFYFIFMGRARKLAGAMEVMFVSSAIGAVVALAMALILGENILPQSAQGWWAVIALAVFCQTIAQGSIAFALGAVAPAPAAVMQTLQPIATAALGVWLMNEPMSPERIAAACLALVGVVIAQVAARRAR